MTYGAENMLNVVDYYNQKKTLFFHIWVCRRPTKNLRNTLKRKQLRLDLVSLSFRMAYWLMVFSVVACANNCFYTLENKQDSFCSNRKSNILYLSHIWCVIWHAICFWLRPGSVDKICVILVFQLFNWISRKCFPLTYIKFEISLVPTNLPSLIFVNFQKI